jgi:hypothetical protein
MLEGMATSQFSPRPLKPHEHGDLLSRAGYRQTVSGAELAWVRSVNGDAANPAVVLSLDQLTLCGPYEALRERLMALVGLLDDLVASPQRWPEVSAWENVGPKSWHRVAPNPFVRQPTLSPR